MRPSVRMGARTGEGEGAKERDGGMWGKERGPERGNECPRTPPFCANGVARTGDKEGGSRPSCIPPRRGGGGGRGGLVRLLSALERGGGQCGGGDEGRRMMQGMGAGLASCVVRCKWERRRRWEGDGDEEGTLFAHGVRTRVAQLCLPRQWTWQARFASATGPTPLHRAQWRTGIRGTQCPPPPVPFPFSPVHATTFARKGAHEGMLLPPPFCSTSPLAPPSHLAAPPCTRGKGARDSRSLPSPFARKGRGYGCPTTLRRPRPHPFPHVRATPFARTGGVRGQTTPPLHIGPGPAPSLLSALPHSRGMRVCEGKTRGKGTREAPPPPSLFATPGPSLPPWPRHPVRAGNARACYPRFPPSPLAWMGGATRAHRPASPRHPAPFPFPFCATSFVQKGCTRPPAPPFLGRATPYAQRTQEHATPGSLPHSCGRDARGDAAPIIPFPLAALPHTRGKGVCEDTPSLAPPFPIRADGGCTRARRLVRAGRGARGQAMPASPRVAQQGRRGLCASAFTAPAPRFRAP
ncbi:hypothetical protein EDB83DRAFT_2312017 [Lactarius deliciosus]|nr:hypothetical protein EDB83DRAFT_2312017 [Lactarius deliciosus]